MTIKRYVYVAPQTYHTMKTEEDLYLSSLQHILDISKSNGLLYSQSTFEHYILIYALYRYHENDCFVIQREVVIKGLKYKKSHSNIF